MANVDVSELMSDPDFIDPMSLITRVPTVNAYGENNLSDSTLVSVGSIQPISGNTVQKVPDGMSTENLRSFWFKGVIVASASGQYSSILVFGSARYQVKHVFDWSNWGSGWTEGLCVSEVVAP